MKRADDGATAAVPLAERLAERGLYVATGLTAFALLAVPVAVCGLGVGGLVRPAGGLGSILAFRWSDGGPYGVLVPLAGTLLVGFVASLWAAPVGIGAATWLRWLAPARVRRNAREIAAGLSAVPPVVAGFVGLVAVPPVLARLGGVPDGRGFLAAVIVVGALALPPVIAGADRAMARLPRRRFEAALSLGATRSQAIRVVIWPLAAVDLGAAALLGVGRALGDTMVVLLVAGDDHGLLGPVRTLTTTIARELPGAGDPAHRGALYVLAAALVTLGVAVGALRARVEQEGTS